MHEVEVKRGDVVVLGTDGLLDNVYQKDITEIAWTLFKKGESPREVAKALTIKARVDSHNETWNSPFAAGAAEAGLFFPGGKPDDITVVVAYVVDDPRRRKIR